MINNFTKSDFYQKVKPLKSYLILIFLITFTPVIVGIFDKFKTDQISSLQNIFENTYLQKTLLSISNSLEPRFETINHVISSGESFEVILEKIKIHKKEKKKNFRIYSKK